MKLGIIFSVQIIMMDIYIVPDRFSILSTLETPLPDRIGLLEPYPNPFNSRINIRYALPEASPVKVEICDIRGRIIEILSSGTSRAGNHTAVWDGSGAGSGLYLVRLTTPGKTLSKKILLVK